MKEKNEWIEWIKKQKGRFCTVVFADNSEISGKIVRINYNHLNFLLDIGEELALIRNFRYMRIEK